MRSRKWAEIKATLRPETRAGIEAGARELAEECISRSCGKARALAITMLPWEAMAELLGVSRAEVSKTERRAELYVGTLRKFIEAMDGELVLAARFKNGVEVPLRLNDGDRAA